MDGGVYDFTVPVRSFLHRAECEGDQSNVAPSGQGGGGEKPRGSSCRLGFVYIALKWDVWLVA